MNKLLLLIILFISQSAFSGEIAKKYGQGVFGIKWGGTTENIKQAFPKGKLETYKEVVMYVVRDGQELFNIKRKRNAFITFGFDPENKFNSVAIDFPMRDYNELRNNLDEKFGTHTMKSDNSTARIAVWPKDEGVELSLVMARAGFFSQEVKTSFNIIYTGTTKND